MQKGISLKIEILGVAFLILGLTLRAFSVVSWGLILGVVATWIGVILAVVGCFSRDD